MHRTERDSVPERTGPSRPRPGLVIAFSADEPVLAVHAVGRDGLVVGRDLIERDDRMSRHHVRIRRVDGAFAVADVGSRNGTFVDSRRIADECWVHPPAIVRAGRTVGLLVEDVTQFDGARFDTAGDAIVGPTLAPAWARIARAARASDHLLVTGESGTGKELAARAFHAASARRGPLVAVNCAAIPAGVAERLLFGTRRGAYSGADVDADGYLASADGGTVFLDEIAELDLAVQAKLLRVLETREVLQLGSVRPHRIDIRVVAATLRDLRAEVAARRFRDDLYYRIGRPEIRLPALRDRREEIPWLIARAVGGLAIHPALVEACLLRPWPGNARELVGEIRRAAVAAREAGRDKVRAEDLEPLAGLAIADEARDHAPPTPLPDRETIVHALEIERGNVSRAARVLGLRRNQLRRFLARNPELAARGG
jgi:transcriptional regulator with PAS, ATPase and Fis domain